MQPILALALILAALTGCGEAAQRPPTGPSRPGVEVWAVGDSSDGGPAARRVARLIARARPDRLLYLGDVYYRTEAQEQRGERAHLTEDQRQATAFGFFEADYGPLLRRILPAAGNHDRAGFFDFWQDQGRVLAPYARTRIAGWDLLSLDSEGDVGRGSDQYEWMKGALARRSGDCRLAFFHRPRHSAGKYADKGGDLEALWSLLRGHARLVVNAHDHNMQRLRPIDGITVLISGAGGHSHYDVDEGDPALAFENDEDDGALRLELWPGSAAYSFRDVSGRVLDAGWLRCSQGKPNRPDRRTEG